LKLDLHYLLSTTEGIENLAAAHLNLLARRVSLCRKQLRKMSRPVVN